MSYLVTGAAAVVELDDGKPELHTGRKVYLEQGSLLSENAKPAHVEHLVAVSLVSEVEAADEDDVDGDGPIPAKSAAKDVWVGYAVSKGASQEEAEASTKDDLIAAYGSA